MSELFEKSIRVLELPQLLSQLERHAVSDAAKERARKLMPSTDRDEVFMAENDIENPDDIKKFDRLGYIFRSDLSSDSKYVFERKIA